MIKDGGTQFEGIVANALDFLERSIVDMETSPKNSLITFTAAIELFLKARLMLEHWSLVLEDPGRAELERFKKGDFKSVGMEESIRRLQNIAGVRVPREAHATLKNLRDHRNRLIHFFHESYNGMPDDSVEAVVILQFRAWFHLHILLTQHWKLEFKAHRTAIQRLHVKLKKMRWYLKERFERLLPAIDQIRESGKLVIACPNCEYEACASERDHNEIIMTDRCLVCERSFRRITGRCPECGSPVCVYAGKVIECRCGLEVEARHLVKIAAPPSEERVYCGACWQTETGTVIRLDSNQALCLFCLELYSEIDIGQCGWCGESAAGEKGDSHNPGCPMCAVYIAQEAAAADARSARSRK